MIDKEKESIIYLVYYPLHGRNFDVFIPNNADKGTTCIQYY